MAAERPHSTHQPSAGRVAILAGSGRIPQKLAMSLAQAGREPFIVCLGGERHAWAAEHEHISVNWGEVGRLIRALRAAGVTQVCLAGHVVRPDVRAIRFDLGGLFALPRILKAGLGGDDAILRHIITLFEEKGFAVVGPHELAPELVLPAGFAAGCPPYKDLVEDLRVGLRASRHLAPLDIGQALVVVRRQIVAVEGIEGTDGLLARVREMRDSGRLRAAPGEGLLVKAAKPGQELRVDLPAVGLRTLEGARKAGLGALALEAGRVIAPDWQEIAERARALELHVASFAPEDGTGETA